MVNETPLKPERVVEFMWGMSMLFSDSEHERKYGDYAKGKWDALSEKFEDDEKASKYFANINAAMSATIYHLAQVRKETNEGFAYLDTLQKREIEDLDDIVKLSKDAESIATRLAGLSVGAEVTLLQAATDAIGIREVAFMGIGAVIGYIVLEVALRIYRWKKAPMIMEEIKKEKERLKSEESEPKTKKIVAEFLKELNAISSEIYQSTISDNEINTIATNFMGSNSASNFTSGRVPTSIYSGSGVEYGKYGSGAIDLISGKIRTNHESETDSQNK